jgi:hypothetical protein
MFLEYRQYSGYRLNVCAFALPASVQHNRGTSPASVNATQCRNYREGGSQWTRPHFLSLLSFCSYSEVAAGTVEDAGSSCSGGFARSRGACRGCEIALGVHEFVHEGGRSRDGGPYVLRDRVSGSEAEAKTNPPVTCRRVVECVLGGTRNDPDAVFTLVLAIVEWTFLMTLAWVRSGSANLATIDGQAEPTPLTGRIRC